MGNFAVGDTRQNRVISICGPPVLQVFEGPKAEPCLQGPKGDKGDFGSDGKTAMAADIRMVKGKIINLVSPTNDIDAVNKSCMDNIRHFPVFYYNYKLNIFNYLPYIKFNTSEWTISHPSYFTVFDLYKKFKIKKNGYYEIIHFAYYKSNIDNDALVLTTHTAGGRPSYNVMFEFNSDNKWVTFTGTGILVTLHNLN